MYVGIMDIGANSKQKHTVVHVNSQILHLAAIPLLQVVLLPALYLPPESCSHFHWHIRHMMDRGGAESAAESRGI